MQASQQLHVVQFDCNPLLGSIHTQQSNKNQGFLLRLNVLIRIEEQELINFSLLYLGV